MRLTRHNTSDGTTDNGWSIAAVQARSGELLTPTGDLVLPEIRYDLKGEVRFMQRVVPHYLLFTEVLPARAENQGGQWRFTLQQVDGPDRQVVADWEPEFSEERLQLLSVVRGLEALDQPSRVTLITACRSVDHGIRIGLEQWREDNWQWESFGEMTPIKSLDLWRRIDRAMRFHQLQSRYWKTSMAESLGVAHQAVITQRGQESATEKPSLRWGWASQAAATTRQAVQHLAKIGRNLSVNCAANL